MELFSKTPKIRVIIVGGAFPRKRNCEVVGNKIIIKKAKEGRGGAAITAEYDNDSLIPYYSGIPPFRSIKHYLVLKDGATRCVSFKNPENYVAPSLTILDVFNYFKSSVLMAAGRIKPENKTIIYLLLGVVIILQIVSMLVNSGTIRF